jgi:hypothetical protein
MFMKCYSDNGNINIKIPSNTSATVRIETQSGSISYLSLNIAVSSSSIRELIGSLGSGTGTTI